MTGPNVTRDPDSLLAAWLDEGPTDLPDGTRRAILTALPTTPQARRGLLAPRRSPVMNTFARGAAVLIVLVVAVGALALIVGPKGGIGGPGPSPSQSPTTTAPSPTPCQIPLADQSLLGTTPCRSVSDLFRPALSVGGDSRWQVVSETVRGLQLNVTLPGGEPNMEGISFVTLDRLAASPCQAGGQMTDRSTIPFRPTANGSGPADIFAWITANTPLRFPTAQAVTVAGHAGLQSTLDLPDGSPAACGGTVFFTWTTDAGAPNGQWHLADGGLEERLTALDVNGSTVVIQTWAPTDRFATVVAEADKLLAGLRFQ